MRRIFCNHEPLASGERRASGDVEVRFAPQPPAAEVHGSIGAIVKLDVFVVRDRRDCMIHDFANHYLRAANE